MFCDETIITVEAGTGGSGIVSFFRTKYNSHGGPDGGDGGKGGDIVLRGNQHLNTLSDLNAKKVFSAEDGVKGGRNNCAGRMGEDLILDVPLGTRVIESESKQLLFDITKHDQLCVVAKGGKGGFGNAHFKASTRQAPKFAEQGEPGEVNKLSLELQVIADVAIIGYPSAGKSTLISVISAARPKIGDYPFTTLVPNLGVVKMSDFGGTAEQDFVIADIPGLIEGAHEGKGLGDQFLKHIRRSALLVHLIDLAREDFVEGYQVINNELMLFDPRLLERKQFVVLNKADIFGEEELQEKIDQFLEAYPNLKDQIYVISGVQQRGLKELVFALADEVNLIREAEIAGDLELARDQDEEVAFKVFRPHLNDPQRVSVEEIGKVERYEEFTNNITERKLFKLTGQRLEQIVKMSDLENDQALARVYDVLDKKKVGNKLKALGAKPGDILQIAGQEVEWLG